MTDVKIKIFSEEVPKPKKVIGVRHFQLSLMFLTLVVFFAIRTAPSVAIISMVEETPPDPSIPTYPEWDNRDTILSSFFWGYIVPQVGAGQLSEYFGPKWFLVTTMVLGSIANIVIPPMASAFGSTGVIICRVVQGLNQGFLYPSLSNLISRWTPLYERSVTANFVFGGANVGIAIGMVVTGAISGSKLGWPASYYIFGGVGIAWAVIFAIFLKNLPSDHKSISDEERKYIESSNSVTQTKKKVPTPWLSILTSVPIWAVLIAGISQCWGGFTLLTEIPTYMDSMLNFDISSNSQLSALPYLAQFIMGLVVGPFFDKLTASQTLSISAARKISQILASILPAAALIYLAFLETFEKDVVIVLLILAVGTSAFQQSGYLVNLIDLAPNHSGTLLGMVNGINNIFSLLAPLTVGLLGTNKKDPILWRKVFLLTAGIYVGCGLCYGIFSSAEVQSWNDSRDEENKEDKTNDIKNKK